jgi:hypothetical protein
MILQLGCTSGIDADLLDSGGKVDVSVLFPFFISGMTLGVHSEGCRDIDEVLVVSEVKGGFVVMSGFHLAERDCRLPLLSIEGSKTSGGKVASQNAMTFTDEEPVVVLAVHEVVVTDLEGQSVKSFGQSDNIVFRFGQKGDVSIDQRKRMESVEVQERSLRYHGYMQ